MTLTAAARKGLRHPRKAAKVVMSIGRGWRCKLWCRVRGVRFSAGRNLRVEGRLIIRGPGRVIFGDNVSVSGTVTPWTYSRDACIEVGDDTFLNGTRFGCQQHINVGPRCILADARIMDTDFHSTSANRHDPEAPVRVAPVRLAENVWVAAQAGILPGSRVGQNSVVAFGTVCTKSYPANVVIAGCPGEVVGPIPDSTHGVAAEYRLEIDEGMRAAATRVTPTHG